MCGLFGTWRLPSIDVRAGLDRIAHRGPDGSGIVRAGDAVLGHVRLSLLDLSDASAQPFAVENGTLAFNGEIWNHAELRRELAAEGAVFRTAGDTEVLATALARWGVDAALPRIEGQFAFAWVSGAEAVLVRDRFGEVPIYATRSGAGFAWSSERKGFPDGTPADPVPPGTVLDLATGRLRRWYRLPDAVPDAAAGPAVDVAGLLDLGVARRLAADAPVAILVSGGLDSSLILALAAARLPDVVAYTAILDETATDLAAARRITADLGVELREVRVRPPSPADLETAALAIETASKPQVEIAALCLPLGRAIAADGVKAVLSGEGADEMFGGYRSLCAKGWHETDDGWRKLRRDAVARMARGNFVRTNKAFMAAGVEVRLPFLETGLAEAVLSMGKDACPVGGKRLLKESAKGILPEWARVRRKETFQKSSGMDAAAAGIIPDPARFYRSTIRSHYGRSAL